MTHIQKEKTFYQIFLNEVDLLLLGTFFWHAGEIHCGIVGKQNFTSTSIGMFDNFFQAYGLDTSANMRDGHVKLTLAGFITGCPTAETLAYNSVGAAG